MQLDTCLCSALGVTPARLHRMPLAYVWLCFNAFMRTQGLDTTWLSTAPAAADRAALHEHIAALRAM